MERYVWDDRCVTCFVCVLTKIMIAAGMTKERYTSPSELTQQLKYNQDKEQ